MSVDLKQELRRQALQARRAGGDAAALTRNLGKVLAPHRGAVVAGYWPIRDEADPRPALEGHDGPLCLPVVLAPATPLLFREWDGTEETLDTGSFGTRHPKPELSEMRPDVVIVPLAGFDRQGNRLGYGGGFYDRTLAELRRSGPVIAIACAFAGQELALIPAEPTDEPLDLIVTDREILVPTRG
ncbi:5-formyltetrahydrofolate cyclo-ligase [Paracoccus aminophilus]|uniref:5-formyltetrahydrofolate cyclo-ligase n=1 Tax=Paracoccus aminophilus TaxID=34003 RepID=UPI000A00400F|nr:5-formyltetrahydrofolate cyclo-ligase [Paracoccus aminophilus]